MAKLDHFFEKYGGLTIVITRFMPFFRTFAPFIAGTGHMNFAKFTFFNCLGGISWVSLFVLVGYFFGGVPFVQKHFEVIVSWHRSSFGGTCRYWCCESGSFCTQERYARFSGGDCCRGRTFSACKTCQVRRGKLNYGGAVS